MFAALLRSLDTPGTFAHWRADAFVWIIDTTDPLDALNSLVSAVRAALAKPLEVAGHNVWLSLNFGLATDALVAGGDLLAAARDALQSARDTNDSSAVYYNGSMEANAASTFTLASGLHHAIDHEELVLHYQPILELSTNQVVGVEALVRWDRPGVGLLAPSLFIDAAERTGQMVALGNWVIRTACRNALQLGSHSGGPRTMSINVSALQLRDPSLITTLRDAMADGKCLPSTIVVEVTESVLLHDLQAVAKSLEAIKALDVGLDLDDFGTGFSSLHYLKNLPIDRLKVDQGFVAGLGINTADTAIVASTIGLAHALGLKAIAEGVETTDQLALLRALGCDYAQGYLLSRPVDIDALATWIDSYVPAALAPTPTVLLRQRSKGADRRDAEADTRDTTADGREATADQRERVADLRDIAATEREDAEDNRERTSSGSIKLQTRGDSTSTRRTAKQDRRRATADRVDEASDRVRASKGRDAARAGREGRADAHAEHPAPASSEVDGAS
jgi:EAL domain-containing protein (putative c-di-GMP-specific phosphodiesterase class I)